MCVASFQQLDLSNVYGLDNRTEGQLRAYKGGKLKSQLINDEEYPPFLADVSIPVEGLPEGAIALPNWFAVGKPFMNLLPGLALWSTIWLREHNRVAEIMQKAHPSWDDERIYQTTKIILLGRLLRIVVEDYVEHLSGYKFNLLWDCELTQDFIQYQTRAFYEFNLIYQFHSLSPDFHVINKTVFDTGSLFYQPNLIIKYGTREMVKSSSVQIAGQLGLRNDGIWTIDVMKRVLNGSRAMGLQSYNNYRRRFGLHPYESFEELTGEKELAANLKELYGSVDAVEFLVGLQAERVPEDAFFPLSYPLMIGAFALFGVFGNEICSPGWYRPHTFGGKVFI